MPLPVYRAGMPSRRCLYNPVETRLPPLPDGGEGKIRKQYFPNLEVPSPSALERRQRLSCPCGVRAFQRNASSRSKGSTAAEALGKRLPGQYVFEGKTRTGGNLGRVPGGRGGLLRRP